MLKDDRCHGIQPFSAPGQQELMVLLPPNPAPTSSSSTFLPTSYDMEPTLGMMDKKMLPGLENLGTASILSIDKPSTASYLAKYGLGTRNDFYFTVKVKTQKKIQS